MTYLVFSDLHGSKRGLAMLDLAIREHKPDVVLCLGDTLYGAYDGDAGKVSAYLSALTTTILGVRGNCDYYYDEQALGFALPEEQTLYFAGHRLYLRHAPFWKDFNPGDVAIYGHTHVKELHKNQGTVFLNPGSIGKPRDGSPSYALIREDGIELRHGETLELLQRLSF